MYSILVNIASTPESIAIPELYTSKLLTAGVIILMLVFIKSLGKLSELP